MNDQDGSERVDVILTVKLQYREFMSANNQYVRGKCLKSIYESIERTYGKTMLNDELKSSIRKELDAHAQRTPPGLAAKLHGVAEDKAPPPRGSLFTTGDELKLDSTVGWKKFESPNSIQTMRDQLRTLPLWAVVAFAARCARRVEYLAHDELLFSITLELSLSELLEITEESATNAAHVPRAAHHVEKALRYIPYHRKIGKQYGSNCNTQLIAAANWAYAAVLAAYTSSANAAHHARSLALDAYVDHADYAADASRAREDCVAHAELAACDTENAAKSAAEARFQVDDYTCVMIMRDLERLLHQARVGHWTEMTPVSPTVFGDLWPTGSPAWLLK